MAFPFPTDPATPSLPNPYFQDNGFVRGDQQRSNNSQIWADMTYLNTFIVSAILNVLYEGLYISNNAAVPDTKVDMAAGACSDSTRSQMITLSAITKDLGSVWAVGTGNGGLDTGALANNTWYYPYAIKRTDSGVTDVVWSANSTSPALPTSYTVYRRARGAILTDGAAKIRMFWQAPDYWMYWSNGAIAGTTNAIPLDVNVTNPGTSANLGTLSVPPLGVVARIIAAGKVTAATSSMIYLSPTGTKDIAPSDTVDASPLAHILVIDSNPRAADAKQMDIPADGSSQFRYRLSLSDANVKFFVVTLAWLEPLS